MALFGKKGTSAEGGAAPTESGFRPLMARQVFCGVCNAQRTFSRCWLRVAPVKQCTCCGGVFEKPEDLYKRFQPACPRCREFLEQPGFDYGLCDTCGSKYELVAGTKPSLLPNKKQRDAMDRYGQSWSRD